MTFFQICMYTCAGLCVCLSYLHAQEKDIAMAVLYIGAAILIGGFL